MRMCLSIGRMDGRSIGWMVHRSVTVFIKYQKWTVFFKKIIGAVKLWHCWMFLMFRMCLICLMWSNCPRTHYWPAGFCFYINNYFYICIIYHYSLVFLNILSCLLLIFFPICADLYPFVCMCLVLCLSSRIEGWSTLPHTLS